MKKIILTIFCTFLSINLAFAHEDETGITLESKIATTVNAGVIHYTFDLYDNEAKRNITESDLKESHEKILHLFVYDVSLKEFQHIHPVFINDEWCVDIELKVNGKYTVWAQATLASDGDEFTAGDKFNVINGTTANPTPPVLGNIRTATSTISQVDLTGKVQANTASMLMVKFSRTDGTQPEISDYLGAFAHVVVVPADGSALIHAHPMPTGKPNEGMIHVNFPKVSDYRIWVQFIDAGILKTTALSVQVLK